MIEIRQDIFRVINRIENDYFSSHSDDIDVYSHVYNPVINEVETPVYIQALSNVHSNQQHFTG